MNFYDALQDTRIMYGFAHGFERSGSSDGEIITELDTIKSARNW